MENVNHAPCRPDTLAYECGKRIRALTDSNGWFAPKMDAMRELVVECAGACSPSVGELRRLMVAVGTVAAADDVLDRLVPDHAYHVWRGFYGAPFPGTPEFADTAKIG